jgi:AraC-like DNA-binding protein
MSKDTLSEVLRAVRLTGAIFFSVDARNPWAVEAQAGKLLAPVLMPGSEHLIEYHVVTAGSCWGGILGESAIELHTGDIIVFPQGDPHVMASGPGMKGTGSSTKVLEMARESQLPLRLSPNGGGDGGVQLICGFLGCDARPFNPLLSALPRVLHVTRAQAGDGMLESFVRLALAETEAGRAGGEAVLARLSELMFVEVVRRYLTSLPPENVGWLAGLRDEHIGRALGRLHGSPARDWSLDDLAREVAMSRSVLAERFAQFVGVPPMQYLAQWRMQLTASLLAGTSLGLGEIAEQVGYGSEAALSRAFKRLVGIAPADWRRGKRVDAISASNPD